MDIFSTILPYLQVKDLCKVDLAFLNKETRPLFLKFLKQQKTMTIEGNMFLLDKHVFIRWLKKRRIRFQRIILKNATTFLFNSVIFLHHRTIQEIEIHSRGGSSLMSKESIGSMSLSCSNLKSFTYHNGSLEDNEYDFFYEVHPDFLRNLEYLHLNCCSNYALLLLTVYAKKLTYIKIDELSVLNPGIVHDMIAMKYPMCIIDCDLNWSIQTNLLLIRQREPGSVINSIDINCDDADISNDDILTDMFKNHKEIKKMRLENVFDVRVCVDFLNKYVDSVEIVVLSGINMFCLRSILDIVNKKRICTLKIIYKPTSIEICVLNLKMLFKNLSERHDDLFFLLTYIEIVVDISTTIIDNYMNFENYTELVGYIENVLVEKKIQLLKFNHKFIRLNTNWKNDIYQYFLF